MITKERKKKEEKLINFVLESWCELMPPPLTIGRDIARMSDKALDKEIEFIDEVRK